MPNMTMTEWTEVEATVAAGLQARWPWLMRLSAYQPKLRVETAAMAATAELDWDYRDGSATCVVRIGSSGCCTGGVIDIAEHARQICEVRDAMLYVHGATAGIVVWRDGECPCRYCGGKGTSQGRMCEKCNGSGKV
jgi:hypothetical protein